VRVFSVLCAEFAWRVSKVSEESLSRVARFVELRQTWGFRLFLWALGLATLTVFVRSVLRCAELCEGFRGKLANQEVTFMVLECGMIVTAVAMLTICHPRWGFRGRWQDAGWSLRGDRLGGGKVMVQRGVGRDWTNPYSPEKMAAGRMAGETPEKPCRP
jgi:RTA1 like protein